MCLKPCRWACIGIILVVFMLPATILAKRESRDFTLYPGKDLVDPYIQEYEITLEREGLVGVDLRVATVDRKMKNILLMGISKKLKREIQTTALYRSKEKGAVLRHAVDCQALKIGRTYIVYVGNISTKRNAAGTLAIEYPAGPEESKPTATPPDLSVTRIWLNKECKVRVAVTNPGPANLAPGYYQQKVPGLYLYRNGKPWGGVTLAALDPQRRLVEKGGQVVFTSNLKIQGTEKIRVVIDNRNGLKDREERNNALNVELTCRAAPAAAAPLKPATVQAVPVEKPDLLVQSVGLTSDCRVMIGLINKGPGELPDSAWGKKTSPTLMLYRNGKSWGGASLTVIDPKQRLKEVNGRARYVSNLKVGGQMNIQAVIDYHGILAETNKINNAKVEALQCK